MRVDELPLTLGPYPRGAANAITDVAGVRVGHATIAEGDLRTGVTAVVPDVLGPTRRSLPAGLSVGNGFGKLIGATQIDELGAIETPVLLTSTLSAFRVADALVGHVLSWSGYEDVTTLNPVVGETNDGFLSDVRARAVTADHVGRALDTACAGPVEEGCVGAGTGTIALGYKGGIGTSSRVVAVAGADATVGALVQSNFGGVLTVAGVPMPADKMLGQAGVESPGNSCMIVVATDASVDARQLGRVARRAVFAMARVGASFSHGSGDYALAFSMTDGPPPDDAILDPLFGATMDAVEEALLNSLLMATTTYGTAGRIARAVPTDVVRQRLLTAGVLDA
ncbi:P1 family peptidase [Mumia zhuanghuii]|uniref:P1 family peptidase n=1 Tax=Mumia zhuanghuii TaxID=2585211 RepID=A0A5C4MQI7_9ACTN|nr:P1 family peptidase [Mumia zhuanghuii]TNC40473.1 P1 family peptidase [Mumia zhuanghuii]TNC46328.1 P1 family peptidase [Mumia zhuanghuii]